MAGATEESIEELGDLMEELSSKIDEDIIEYQQSWEFISKSEKIPADAKTVMSVVACHLSSWVEVKKFIAERPRENAEVKEALEKLKEYYHNSGLE